MERCYTKQLYGEAVPRTFIEKKRSMGLMSFTYELTDKSQLIKNLSGGLRYLLTREGIETTRLSDASISIAPNTLMSFTAEIDTVSDYFEEQHEWMPAVGVHCYVTYEEGFDFTHFDEALRTFGFNLSPDYVSPRPVLSPNYQALRLSKKSAFGKRRLKRPVGWFEASR
jgi:hypothetical protein